MEIQEFCLILPHLTNSVKRDTTLLCLNLARLSDIPCFLSLVDMTGYRVVLLFPGGFKAADKAKLARRMEEEQRRVAQLPAEVPSKTTIQFGLATHRVFKTFALFCHGLFAGFAFWHITMVFTMINTSGAQVFLTYYHTLAQPVQSLYFLLFVLCTVSAFDR